MSFKKNLRGWHTDLARQSAGPASDVRIIDPATGKVTQILHARPAPKTVSAPTSKSLRVFNGTPKLAKRKSILVTRQYPCKAKPSRFTAERACIP
jgi:hypothetical protein